MRGAKSGEHKPERGPVLGRDPGQQAVPVRRFRFLWRAVIHPRQHGTGP